jgi:hypothetical protein
MEHRERWSFRAALGSERAMSERDDDSHDDVDHDGSSLARHDPPP